MAPAHVDRYDCGKTGGCYNTQALLSLHLHRCPYLDMVVEKFRAVGGHADTTVRCRISRQDPDMHADAVSGQPHEPLHRCALEVRAARC